MATRIARAVVSVDLIRFVECLTLIQKTFDAVEFSLVSQWGPGLQFLFITFDTDVQ